MHWFYNPPIGLILAAVLAALILFLLVLREFGVNVTPVLPKSVWKRSLLNSFFVLLIGWAIMGVIILIAVLGFRQTFINGLLISIAAGWMVLLPYSFFTWILNRRKAGRVLLDVGPFPHRVLFIIFGVFFIFNGFYDAFFDQDEIFITFSWLIPVITHILFGITLLLLSFSRIRIREDGISASLSLYKWSKIETINWVSDDGKLCALKYTIKGRLPKFMRSGAIPIPIEKKGEVDPLLRLHLPGETLTNTSA